MTMTATGVLLRVVAAIALLVSAYQHVVLAEGPAVSAGQITVAGLFLAQAAVATAVAAWVLLAGRRPAWLAVTLVGAGSLVALVLSVYVQIPAFGPFPVLYEPYWYPQKVAAAVPAAVAAVVGGLALSRVARR